MVQYNDFGAIPQSVQDYVANRCRILDRYILFQTGEQEYTALIQDPVSGKTSQLRIYWMDPGMYDVIESEGEWNYIILNDFYCYSNVGLGSALDLPVTDGIVSYAAITFTVYLMFLVVFRGLLFPFRKKSK